MGSHPILLDIELVLLEFGPSYRLAHRLIQYPVILDGYPSNKIYLLVHIGSLYLRRNPRYVLLLSSGAAVGAGKGGRSGCPLCGSHWTQRERGSAGVQPKVGGVTAAGGTCYCSCTIMHVRRIL